MNSRQPAVPGLAIWLLARIDIGSCGESLTGVLIEERVKGRSAAWFWSQVLAGITICVCREIQTHKLVAISAGVTGLASLWCSAVIATLALVRAGLMVHAVNWRWPHYTLLFVSGFAYVALSAWIVGQVHRAHRTAAVFSFLASVWIVPLFELPLLYWFEPSVFFLSIVPHIPFFLIALIIGAPLGILFGGFYGASRGAPPATRT